MKDSHLTPEDLEPLAFHRQQELVREDPSFWNRSLCMLLCHESKKLCAASPARAVKLAELALTLAEMIEGGHVPYFRLTAIASAYLGNALRVRNNHVGARKAFAKTDGAQV